MWRYYDYNSELYHHGVKGMKWGVRRSPEQLGHRVSKHKKSIGAAAGKVGKNVKSAGSSIGRGVKTTGRTVSRGASSTIKGIKNAKNKIHEARAERIIRSADPKTVLKNQKYLSDSEYNRAVNRIDKKQKLSGLKKDSPAKNFVKKGSISVGHALEKSGTGVLAAATAGALAYAGHKYMIKKGYDPQLAGQMFKGAKDNKYDFGKNPKKYNYVTKARKHKSGYDINNLSGNGTLLTGPTLKKVKGKKFKRIG